MPQKLKKTGTMQQVTKVKGFIIFYLFLRNNSYIFCVYQEGESYLERTWGPEKLKTARAFGVIFSDTNPAPSTSNSQDDVEPPTKRPKLAKHTTMMNTAKVLNFPLKSFGFVLFFK